MQVADRRMMASVGSLDPGVGSVVDADVVRARAGLLLAWSVSFQSGVAAEDPLGDVDGGDRLGPPGVEGEVGDWPRYSVARLGVGSLSLRVLEVEDELFGVAAGGQMRRR